MASERNKAILQEANAAIAAGDIEGFLRSCTDDTQWTFVGDRTLRGKDAVRRWMVETYVQPPRNEVAELIAEGDSVVARGVVTVTDRAGTATRNAYCDVWHFRDGKMADLEAFVVEA